MNFHKGDELIFKAASFSFAFYLSIDIISQNLPDSIQIFKRNWWNYDLYYGSNKLSIKRGFLKTTFLLNGNIIGKLTFPRKITFGYSLSQLEIDSKDETLNMYFLILELLHVPTFRNSTSRSIE